MFSNNLAVHVQIEGRFVPAGELTYIADGAKSHCEFSYFRDYLSNPLAISVDSVQLPLKEGIFKTNDDSEYFNGIRDACPDSWGDLLLEIAAKKINVKLQEIDYILYAGSERIGALGFSTDKEIAPFSEKSLWSETTGEELSLQNLDYAAQKIIQYEDLPDNLLGFFEKGSSIGGARPKATCIFNKVPYIVDP